jgi:hypothetical protein
MHCATINIIKINVFDFDISIMKVSEISREFGGKNKPSCLMYRSSDTS